MKFVRRKISVDAVQPPNTRYDETCGCVQTRASDTSPWQDNPNADPRHADSFRLPAREGSNIKCDAAENMMQHFKAQVDAFLTSITILQFVNSFLTLAALFIPGMGLLTKVIFVVATELTSIGASVINAAMTEEVYDQIKCIIFKNIGEDGQMSAAQLADIQSAIDIEVGGTPNLVFDLFAGAWGEVGWSNAGATGEYEGDCDDCEPCGAEYQFSSGEPAGSVFTLFAGTFSTNLIQQVCVGGFGSTSTLNFGLLMQSGACAYVLIEADIEVIALTTDWYMYGLNDADPSTGDVTLLASGSASAGVQTIGDVLAGIDAYYGLRVIIDTPAGCGTGDVYVYTVRAFGA